MPSDSSRRTGPGRRSGAALEFLQSRDGCYSLRAWRFVPREGSREGDYRGFLRQPQDRLLAPRGPPRGIEILPALAAPLSTSVSLWGQTLHRPEIGGRRYGWRMRCSSMVFAMSCTTRSGSPTTSALLKRITS